MTALSHFQLRRLLLDEQQISPSVSAHPQGFFNSVKLRIHERPTQPRFGPGGRFVNSVRAELGTATTRARGAWRMDMSAPRSTAAPQSAGMLGVGLTTTQKPQPMLLGPPIAKLPGLKSLSLSQRGIRGAQTPDSSRPIVAHRPPTVAGHEVGGRGILGDGTASSADGSEAVSSEAVSSEAVRSEAVRSEAVRSEKVEQGRPLLAATAPIGGTMTTASETEKKPSSGERDSSRRSNTRVDPKAIPKNVKRKSAEGATARKSFGPLSAGRAEEAGEAGRMGGQEEVEGLKEGGSSPLGLKGSSSLVRPVHTQLDLTLSVAAGMELQPTIIMEVGDEVKGGGGWNAPPLLSGQVGKTYQNLAEGGIAGRIVADDTEVSAAATCRQGLELTHHDHPSSRSPIPILCLDRSS